MSLAALLGFSGLGLIEAVTVIVREAIEEGAGQAFRVEHSCP